MDNFKGDFLNILILESQFQKIDPYDGFCGPRSQIKTTHCNAKQHKHNKMHMYSLLLTIFLKDDNSKTLATHCVKGSDIKINYKIFKYSGLGMYQYY